MSFKVCYVNIQCLLILTLIIILNMSTPLIPDNFARIGRMTILLE